MLFQGNRPRLRGWTPLGLEASDELCTIHDGALNHRWRSWQDEPLVEIIKTSQHCSN